MPAVQQLYNMDRECVDAFKYLCVSNERKSRFIDGKYILPEDSKYNR